MLGMVFTEFVEMVETTFSADIADTLLNDCGETLSSGCAYTAVGYYRHDEMLVLVNRLSALTGVAAPDLVHRYGRHLFGRFNVRYPAFFDRIDGAFAFLESVHGHIHVEVRKLYDDARPPSLQCRREGDARLVVDYVSDRPFARLAEGLIDGCIAHYGEPIDVTVMAMADDGRSASFILERRSAGPCDRGRSEASRQMAIP